MRMSALTFPVLHGKEAANLSSSQHLLEMFVCGTLRNTPWCPGDTGVGGPAEDPET